MAVVYLAAPDLVELGDEDMDDTLRVSLRWVEVSS